MGLPGRAAGPQATVGKKTDWEAINGLLAAGDYANAVAAVQNELAKGEKPKRWEADFLPRSVERIRLCMRRGVAELRLGRLDAAEATFAEAYRLFADDDFKLQRAKEARGRNPRTMSALTLIDVDLVELLYLRIAVLLERLRFLNLGIDATSADKLGERPDQVTQWSGEIETLERLAAKARKDLAESFPQGDPAFTSSPYYQALLGRFRPALVAGMKSLELGTFATATNHIAGGATGATAVLADGERTGEAETHFAEAATALDAAFTAAAPKGVDTMKRDARIEAALMQADLLTCEGLALMEAGEPVSARERFAKVMDLRQEVSGLRRIKQPDKHPDLFVPLLLSAETLLDEASLALEAGDASGSRDRILEASKVLARADGLPFPEEHPLRAWQKSLEARDTGDLATVKATIPGNDVADAAARRIQRAMDGTAMKGATTAP